MSGPRESQVSWKPEWHAALSDHLKAGLSASKAAEKLNDKFGTCLSRNAVIGRARRENIPLRATQAVLNAQAGKKSLRPKALVTILGTAPKFKKGRKPGPNLPTSTTELRCDPVTPGMLHLLELEEGMCRYPTGEGAENIRFCGRDRIDGRSYCCAHVRICFRSFDPRPQSTFRPMGRA